MTYCAPFSRATFKLCHRDNKAPAVYDRGLLLYRSRRNRVMAGVCGGMANYCDLDPTIGRLGLTVFTLIAGAGVLAYLVAALIIPLEPER